MGVVICDLAVAENSTSGDTLHTSAIAGDTSAPCHLTQPDSTSCLMLSDESSFSSLQDTQVSCVFVAACSAAVEKEALISLYAPKSGALKLQTNTSL